MRSASFAGLRRRETNLALLSPRPADATQRNDRPESPLLSDASQNSQNQNNQDPPSRPRSQLSNLNLDIDVEIQNTDLNSINDISREDMLEIQIDQMAREQQELLASNNPPAENNTRPSANQSGQPRPRESLNRILNQISPINPRDVLSPSDEIQDNILIIDEAADPAGTH